MANKFWFKFEWQKWLNDRELSRCTFETQGFWVRVICILEETGETFLEGTIAQIANMLGCSPKVAERCISDLETNNAAQIVRRKLQKSSKNQEIVKVVSRRLVKAANLKEYNRIKQAERRNKLNVNTPSKNSSKDIEIKSLRVKTISPNGEIETPKPPLRNIAVEAPTAEVDSWLSVIAPITGAKDARSIIPEQRWRGVIATAIREQRSLADFANVVKGEYARPPNELRYVTPEKCLQILQQSKLKPAEHLPSIEEKRRDDEINRAAMKGPPGTTNGGKPG